MSPDNKNQFVLVFVSRVFRVFSIDKTLSMSIYVCGFYTVYCSYSLSLIDAMDTLVVLGNYSEFRRVVEIVLRNSDFDKDINVSVFETNIRGEKYCETSAVTFHSIFTNMQCQRRFQFDQVCVMVA